MSVSVSLNSLSSLLVFLSLSFRQFLGTPSLPCTRFHSGPCGAAGPFFVHVLGMQLSLRLSDIIAPPSAS